MTVKEASGVAVYGFETWYFILKFVRWSMVQRIYRLKKQEVTAVRSWWHESSSMLRYAYIA